ncbi:transcription elongation factor Spt6p [[Candida] anglica]|uniref:Transcription elongation factor Spt6 n=1 Tax=[Candida] anglica TaxID=148631 RepID=A0ABP0EDQ1_9ASCO
MAREDEQAVEPETRNVGVDSFVDREAEKDSEGEDEDDEEGQGQSDDSSEEDDDDDDEEAIQKVREGFIVDDDEDEEDAVKSKKRRRREKKRKRRVEENVDDDAIDDDDLELIMENSGARPASSSSSGGKFKRLKRVQEDGDNDAEEGGASSRTSSRAGGLNDMFSDDDEDMDRGEEDDGLDHDDDDDLGQQVDSSVGPSANILDEFEDFIEEDEFSDEDEERKRKAAAAQRLQRAKKAGPRLDTSKLSSVDRESLQQLFEVFGNGAEYEWALDAQEIEDDGNGDNMEPTSLDEVFEHAELKERMLTVEDNVIRVVDVPERYQKYRSNLNYIDLDGQELVNQQNWIAKLLFKEKGQHVVGGKLEKPFKEAVAKCVEFISKDMFEVPFIWAHRRDFLLYTEEVAAEGAMDGIEGASMVPVVHKLLSEDDLWRIVQLDIEYHSLYEKKTNIEKLADSLSIDDDLVKDLKNLETMVSIQDVQEYINFTYSKEIREREESEESSKAKKHSKYAVFERIRENVLYDAVKAYGISAKEFGENVQDQSSKGFEVPYRIHATDDALESPEDLLEKICEDDEVLYKDPANALQAVRKTFAEEIFHNPKIRAEVRSTYKDFALVSVNVTEKGKGIIDSHSQYADIKYAINRSPADLVSKPEVMLRMLEAEASGLVVVKVETKDYDNWFQCIINCLKSDGSSDISEQWNIEREVVLKMAFKRLTAMVSLNTKEDLRRECERLVQSEVRRCVLAKVDSAPFTPFGFDKGTKPNVLALSFGKGDFDSAVIGVVVRENGKVDEFFKSESNPSRDRESEEKFGGQLKEFFDKSLRGSNPDVIVVSGFSANSKRLFDSVKNFIQNNSITANTEDLENNEAPAPLIPVIWGQDEVARLYQNSERAKIEFSDKPTLAKYCVALARYVQSPLLEYISLGDDILSLTFTENQKLIGTDLIMDAIETVLVDIVNMVGVEINEALRDPYVAKLLPYVAGLGPRKASGLLRNINSKLGSTLSNRSDLIEHELTTANIFINCSSFLNIPYDDGVSMRDSNVELLDATRIHPQDYDLARKMATDALDLDEEDMDHIEEQGGIIYQLMQDGVGKVDYLNLTAYGKELETKFGKKKYATLQSIKEELVNNYEELRRSFRLLETSEVFQMLTGETTSSFAKDVIVPVTVNKVVKNNRDYENASVRFAKVTTASLIQGSIEENYIPPKAQLAVQQVVQAVVVDVGYESFTADFSLLEADLQRASQPKFIKEVGKWDFEAEQRDLQKELAKERAQLSKTRNVQHPLFHNFNHKQAEEYLAPQAVGDCVLRPSSKGPDYLTVTWKVSNNLFQHLSIHESTSPGGIKEYKVDDHRYSDLDQLIFQHIQAIAKHVDEMCRNPKFREGTMTEVIGWLESYTTANPKNSAYVFCFDHKAPGWFLLLFKVNVNTPITQWHVKTERDGYKLRGFAYPNMLRLCNGFKQTFKSLVKNMSSRGPGGSRGGAPGVNGGGAAPVGSYGGYGF